MKLQALIADDEKLSREFVELLVEAHDEVEIADSCGNGLAAVASIRANHPDLVFLDIRMPDLDGFDVIRQIGSERMPPTIFVTAHDKYALQAFEVNAIDYLLKPYDEQRFYHALSRALRQIRNSHSDFINQKLRKLLTYTERQGNESDPGDNLPVDRLAIRDSGRIVFVTVDEIDWIEAAGDYARIHAGKQAYLLHKSLSSLEAQLSPDFRRIHRSTIVNISRIRELEHLNKGEYTVYLYDGTNLKLSRNFRNNLQLLLG
jgi:two-component system LytT family response regulator